MQRDDPDEFPLPHCVSCGEQLIEGSHKTCPACRGSFCDWCYDDHLEGDCDPDWGV